MSLLLFTNTYLFISNVCYNVVFAPAKIKIGRFSKILIFDPHGLRWLVLTLTQFIE